MLAKYEKQYNQMKKGYNYLKYNYQVHYQPPYLLPCQWYTWQKIHNWDPVGEIQIKMSLPVIGLLQSTPKLV